MSGHNFLGRRDSDTRDLFRLFLLFASLPRRSRAACVPLSPTSSSARGRTCARAATHARGKANTWTGPSRAVIERSDSHAAVHAESVVVFLLLFFLMISNEARLLPPCAPLLFL
ncbi:hypothetical protein AMECASPLE_023253 [Ameca splendens]|uniref:Uncharacterized protein n=1 Tax=Ameca splendens TaxID=208324 RepID=A0ABV0YSC8_9TELE